MTSLDECKKLRDAHQEVVKYILMSKASVVTGDESLYDTAAQALERIQSHVQDLKDELDDESNSPYRRVIEEELESIRFREYYALEVLVCDGCLTQKRRQTGEHKIPWLQVHSSKCEINRGLERPQRNDTASK